LIIKDLDGRKVKILFRGFRRYTKAQLLKAKDFQARRAREGLDLLGRKTLKPNPNLAKRFEEMTLLEFCQHFGLLRSFEILEGKEVEK